MAQLTDAQIAGYLRSAGFPANQIGIGVAIALAESGGRTDALNTANRNGSWDAGLMQVNSIHGHTREYLYNPTNNAAAAFKIYQAAGGRWTPWSAYNNGSYRRFLARGNAAAGNSAAAPPGAVAPVTSEGSGDPSWFTRAAFFAIGAWLLFWGLNKWLGTNTTKIIGIADSLAAMRGLARGK